jgi:hypothetical protein
MSKLNDGPKSLRFSLQVHLHLSFFSCSVPLCLCGKTIFFFQREPRLKRIVLTVSNRIAASRARLWFLM